MALGRGPSHDMFEKDWRFPRFQQSFPLVFSHVKIPKKIEAPNWGKMVIGFLKGGRVV